MGILFVVEWQTLSGDWRPVNAPPFLHQIQAEVHMRSRRPAQRRPLRVAKYTFGEAVQLHPPTEVRQ